MNQKENILVSITTATFNSEKTVERTLQSVLNQTYNNIEYIIVDGNSQDRTLEIAKKYRKKFEDRGYKYKIISEPDKGMYDALNKGIQLAHGEIIGNINSDDWYETDAVEKVVETYKKTNFEFMYGDMRIISPNGTVRIKRSKHSKYITSRNWNHPSQFALRKLYIQEPYKLESMYDDFDLFLRVNRKGYNIEILNEILANFTTEGMSHKRKISAAYKRGKSRYRIYRNNGYSRWYFFECVMIEAAKFILG